MSVVRRAILACCIALVGSLTSTGAECEKSCVDQIIAKAMAGFWGRAKGYDGELLQPADEHERQSLLIPRAEAERVVNEALIYGVAYWCDLDWKPMYLEYMQVENKRKSWGEKQRAFIGVLFRLTQGTVQKSMSHPCTEDEKNTAILRLSEERERLRSLRQDK